MMSPVAALSRAVKPTRHLLWLCALPMAVLAQSPGPGMSPKMTWDAHAEMNTIPAARRLTGAEVQRARERAERVYEVLRQADPFHQPGDRSSMLTSKARAASATMIEQDYIAYWSRPADVRQRPDGAWAPLLGGAHQMLYFATHWLPGASHLEDRATRDNFSRQLDNGGRGGFFAAPRTFGDWAGGTVYADMIMVTHDGRDPLMPAPIGPLLEIEVKRLAALSKEDETLLAQRRRELDASMTPQAVQDRRAKREGIWRKETKDPTALSARLDAAARSDESSYAHESQRLDGSPQGGGSPHSRALESARSLLASLDAAGRSAAACARNEPGFASHLSVRYEVLAQAPAGCVPMVQLRPDLVNPASPSTTVQLLTVWFRGTDCGEAFGGRSFPARHDCNRKVELLRSIDQAALRRALGWP